MISKLKSFLYDKYIDYKYSKIINSYDQDVDVSKLSDEKTIHLSSNGSLFIKNFFENIEIDYFKKNLKWVNPNNSLKKISPLVIEKNSIIHKLLTDNKIKRLILDYIGENAKLDNVEIQRIDQNSINKSISEKWHYDNVGKRIKLFYFLNNTKNIFTEYLNTTNKIKHNRYSISGSRISNRIVSKNISYLEKFYPETNSVLLIDTNGYHRGIYRNQSNINGDNFREMIVFEFSNIKKSEKFYSLSSIIGPRNTYFEKDIGLDDMLLEQKYICDFGKFYKYDLNFVKNF